MVVQERSIVKMMISWSWKSKLPLVWALLQIYPRLRAQHSINHQWIALILARHHQWSTPMTPPTHRTSPPSCSSITSPSSPPRPPPPRLRCSGKQPELRPTRPMSRDTSPLMDFGDTGYEGAIEQPCPQRVSGKNKSQATTSTKDQVPAVKKKPTTKKSPK